MPTSWYQAIPPILEQIQIEKPQSILDIGIGFGKYGLLLRDVVDIPYERYHKEQWQVRIDGIEACEQYKNPLHGYVYDKVYYGDVLDIIDKLQAYDCILLIDVLEHFKKEDGHRLIDKLAAHIKKSLIISTPLYPDAQNDYLGNPYERHISKWSVVDFLEYDFNYKRLDIVNNAAQIFQIFPRNSSYANMSKPVIKSGGLKQPLKIGYILPHRNLTGGLKMLLEQMNQLRKRKHTIYAFLRESAGSEVLPDWYNTKVDKAVLVPPNESFIKYAQECDVLVAGWVGQLSELAQGKVPVVYWEQGHEWLFGDCNDLSRMSKIRQHLSANYSSNVHLAAVSMTVQKILKVRYNRNSVLIPNFIDTDFYFPVKHACRNNILIVGNPTLKFKGFDVALRVLQMLWRQGHPFNVNWICQVQPNIQGIKYPVNIIIKPSQQELANYYRNADILLFTSWYEGFGMPPLEAMASGVSVVTTECGGVCDYIQGGYNALAADAGDIQSMAAGVVYLMQNEQARKVLAKRGRETAQKYNVSNTIAKLEDFLLAAAGDSSITRQQKARS